MNYETLKCNENDALRRGEPGSNAIHLAAKDVEQPTIGYGYDLRQMALAQVISIQSWENSDNSRTNGSN